MERVSVVKNKLFKLTQINSNLTRWSHQNNSYFYTLSHINIETTVTRPRQVIYTHSYWLLQDVKYYILSNID